MVVYVEVFIVDDVGVKCLNRLLVVVVVVLGVVIVRNMFVVLCLRLKVRKV